MDTDAREALRRFTVPPGDVGVDPLAPITLLSRLCVRRRLGRPCSLRGDFGECLGQLQ